MTMDEKRSSRTVLSSALIIGGNGFLGKTMPALISSRHPDCQINLLDIGSSSLLDSGDTHGYYQGDITNLASLIPIFQKLKPSVVIHCASPPIPTTGKGDEKLFFRVNVEGTRNVIAACREAGVKALVYTSSASVVYNGGDLINVNEDIPYASRHVDAYNASKVILSKRFKLIYRRKQTSLC